MKNSRTQKMTYIALFSALAFILMLFDFPLPFFPPFLKFDLSDVFIFLSSFVVGPLGMIAVIVIKNVLHWLIRGAELGLPVGQLASILSSLAYCLTAYVVLKMSKSNEIKAKDLVLPLIAGTLMMTLVMFIANYYFITPFYFAIGNMSLPENYFGYMLMYIPFNIIKATIVSIVILIAFPYVQKILVNSLKKN